MGLREMKKQMTRESIAESALRLTLQKGLANVTVEEIARDAFVSPRTVSNYFSCKEEAVVAAGNEESIAVLDQIGNAPASEQPWQTLRRVLTDFVRHQSDEQIQVHLQRSALVRDNPSLLPYQTARYEELEGALRSVIATRTGTDLDTDIYPWLVASAAVAAVRIATNLWARSDQPTSDALVENIESAFDLFSSGLAPTVSRGRRAG
jgi:AcrR family transcriptional regulator